MVNNWETQIDDWIKLQRSQADGRVRLELHFSEKVPAAAMEDRANAGPLKRLGIPVKVNPFIPDGEIWIVNYVDGQAPVPVPHICRVITAGVKNDAQETQGTKEA